MNDATSDELRAMKQPVTTGPGEAIRQRFSTAEAASMAAGCLRGLLKRHGVQLDAEAQRIIQGVLEMVHETLGMDNDGNVVRTAKESATPRLASPGVEALRALLEEVVLVINYDPPACQTPKGASCDHCERAHECRDAVQAYLAALGQADARAPQEECTCGDGSDEVCWRGHAAISL
jgi:hypothetical protein